MILTHIIDINKMFKGGLPPRQRPKRVFLVSCSNYSDSSRKMSEFSHAVEIF